MYPSHWIKGPFILYGKNFLLIFSLTLSFIADKLRTGSAEHKPKLNIKPIKVWKGTAHLQNLNLIPV